MQTLQGQLAELRSRAALLSNKLDMEKAALKSAVSARDDYMISGDLADEQLGQQLQAAVKNCTSNVSAIQGAIGTLETHIEALERKLKAEEEAAERSAASEKIGADVAAIEAELPRFVEATRMLADRLGQIGWYFDAAQMATYLGNTCNEVELASAFSLAELKRMAERDPRGYTANPEWNAIDYSGSFTNRRCRMRTKVSPPGFQPHQTLSRLDGWIGSADRMPDCVAKEIFAAMPPLRARDVVEIIRARTIARQHAYDRRAALKRSFGARDDD